MLAATLLFAVLASGLDDQAEAKTLYQPDLFTTLIDPDCSHCRDEAKKQTAATLRDDDRVLAWIRGDYTGGAIPYRWFLVPYRVISDTYGVFVYDPDADFVRGWPASLDFRFHGWRNGVMVMKRKDGTIFDCLTGLAVDGPAQGERLKPIATMETNWGPWLRTHPGTVAYEMKPKYKPAPLPTGVLSESRRTRPDLTDTRIDAEARVFGLAVDGSSVAWPLALFTQRAELHRQKIGGQEAVVLWDGSTKTAAAYAPEIDGKPGETVTLVLKPGENADAPWVDEETGSRWAITGRAVSGPRQGQTLRWLPGVMVKWYAWVGSYPKTELGWTQAGSD